MQDALACVGGALRGSSRRSEYEVADCGIARSLEGRKFVTQEGKQGDLAYSGVCLGAPDVQRAGREVDVAPTQFAQLADSKTGERECREDRATRRRLVGASLLLLSTMGAGGRVTGHRHLARHLGDIEQPPIAHQGAGALRESHTTLKFALVSSSDAVLRALWLPRGRVGRRAAGVADSASAA